jgi:hypothetical protein
MGDGYGFPKEESSGSGGGSIDRITSSTLTITNPVGPTTDIELPADIGTVQGITSSTLTITNPTGPIVDIEFAGSSGVITPIDVPLGTVFAVPENSPMWAQVLFRQIITVEGVIEVPQNCLLVGV